MEAWKPQRRRNLSKAILTSMFLFIPEGLIHYDSVRKVLVLWRFEPYFLPWIHPSWFVVARKDNWSYGIHLIKMILIKVMMTWSSWPLFNVMDQSLKPWPNIQVFPINNLEDLNEWLEGEACKIIFTGGGSEELRSWKLLIYQSGAFQCTALSKAPLVS